MPRSPFQPSLVFDDGFFTIFSSRTSKFRHSLSKNISCWGTSEVPQTPIPLVLPILYTYTPLGQIQGQTTRHPEQFSRLSSKFCCDQKFISHTASSKRDEQMSVLRSRDHWLMSTAKQTGWITSLGSTMNLFDCPPYDFLLVVHCKYRPRFDAHCCHMGTAIGIKHLCQIAG